MKKNVTIALALSLIAIAPPALAERKQTDATEIGYVYQWPRSVDIARAGEFKGCLKPNTSMMFNDHGDIVVKQAIRKLDISEKKFTEEFNTILTADNLTVSLKAYTRVQPVVPMDDRFEEVCREIFEKYLSASETDANDTVEPNWYNMVIEERFRFLIREEIARHMAIDIPNLRNEIARAVECKMRDFLVRAPSSPQRDPFDRETLTCSVDDTGYSHYPFQLKSTTIDQIILPQVVKDATDRMIAKEKEVVAEHHNVEIEKAKLEKVKIYAQSQADFLAAINASLSPEVLEYQAIQALGDLICPEANVIVVPNSNVDLLISTP